ncbi:unnamed protein product [Effrenium voratum]|nr:unnamed protein product [Effrenium voratum]
MPCMWYVVLVVSNLDPETWAEWREIWAVSTGGRGVRSCSPFGDWPQVDGVTCGGCRALVQTTSYNRCDRYCESFGHVCVAAAEEVADNCEILEDKACDEEILGTSDMLCTCKLSTAEENCYGSLPALAASEGTHAGKVSTNSLAECQKECDGKANCKSFSFCPQWNGCFLKERVLTGSEPTVTKGKCRSYFKTSCGGSTTATTTVTATTTTTKTTTLAATTTTAESGTLCWSSLGALATSEGNGLGAVSSDISPGKCQSACDAKAGCNSFSFCPQWGKCFLKDRSFTGSEPSAVKGSCETYFRIDCSLTTTTTTFAVGEGNLKAMIVSYNLYWWNAFNQNSWKSDGIIDNLRYTLKPDSAGLQECDSASTVHGRT